MLTVHVRVTDAATSKPTPVRLRIVDARGTYHAPLGRLTRFPTGTGEDVGGQVIVAGQPWAYIDGIFEVHLPPGLLTVEICKGPEYRPLCREVNLAAGQISLRFTIERWCDLKGEGWYAGDIRAHELSPHAALLEGAAEGLAVVQLLARKTTDLLAFSGTVAALPSSECHVVVNTINSHPVLGTVGLLRSHRPVFPLTFGGPDSQDDWSVADWCDQCHRKKGFVTWPDLPRLDEAHSQGEALAALILGKVDAFEVGSSDAIRQYYTLLDAGLAPTLVGGSGKDGNAMPLGAVRTYARLAPGESLSPETWISAVARGRAYVSNGPLLSLRADEAEPGDRLALGAGQTVRIRGEARSASPIDRVELVAGGEVIAAGSASADRLTHTLETEYSATKSTWIVLRCHSQGFAHTSPLWIDVADRPFTPSLPALDNLLAWLDRTRRWVDSEARCGSDKHRAHLLGVLAEASRALHTRRGTP